MSANNQVIIRKVADNKFVGIEVDVDAYGEEENQDYYDNIKPDFTAETLEEAIQKYHRFCEVLAEAGMTVEYGLAFEEI